MASKFTWFPKLTAALERVPEGPRGELCWAIIQYGTNGVEPEFTDWALSAVFESLREDIDNSLAARNKNKGGRPPKARKAETVVSDSCETTETGVSENGNGGFEVLETPETGVSEHENPSLYTSPCQAIPSQTIPGQGSAKACAAPTEEECVAEFGANCLKGDPHAFFDFYASQGWRKSNGLPITDWRKQARQWHRRQVERDAEDRARGRPTQGEVAEATWKPLEDPVAKAMAEVAKAEAEYERLYGEVPR